MIVTRTQPILHRLAWLVLALLAGLLAARLPVTVGGGLLALALLAALVLVEPALGIVLMLALAPLKTLIETEAPVTLPLDVGQVTLAGLVGAWALWRVTARRHAPLPRSRVYLPLVIIMAALSPSLFGALSAGAWLTEMLKWVEMLLLVMIVLDLAHRWRWVAFGVVGAAVLQAVIGLYEFQGGSGAPHLWIMGYRHFRAFGTFGQPNPFSALMGLTLPLALGLAWGHTLAVWASARRGTSSRQNALWQRLLTPDALLAAFYGGAALLLLGGLVASWGRGAWLGFGAAGSVMVFFAPPQRWQGILLIGVAGGLIAALWLTGLLPASIEQRVDNAVTEFVGFQDVRGLPVSDENFAIVERLAHWQAAFSMAGAHPWFGVGLGNYEAVYPAYGVPSWPRPLGHAHNDYLNLMAETGLVGLTGYLIGWALLGWWTLRALRQDDRVRYGLVLGLLGTWTHLAVHSFVDKLYVNNLFLFLGVMLGLLAVAWDHRGLTTSRYADQSS